MGIADEMIQFLLQFVETKISCCAPRLPLILTAKFHSLCVKESESKILERSESDILPSGPHPCEKGPLATAGSQATLRKKLRNDSESGCGWLY